MAANIVLRKALAATKTDTQVIAKRNFFSRIKYNPRFTLTGPRLQGKPGKEYKDPWERVEAWRYRECPSQFHPKAKIDRGNPLTLIPWFQVRLTRL